MTSILNFKFLFLVFLIFLCGGGISHANDISFKDVTKAYDSYAEYSEGIWRCSIKRFIQLNQTQASGPITLINKVPSFTDSLYISDPLEYIYSINLVVLSGIGVISFHATNGVDITKPFSIPYNCEEPPSTIDLELYNNASILFNSNEIFTGNGFVFKINNYFKKGIFAATLSTNLFTCSISYVGNGTYVMYIPATQNLPTSAELNQDEFTLTLSYSYYPSITTTFQVKNTLAKNQIEADIKFYGLEENYILKQTGFYSVVNYTNLNDGDIFSIFTFKGAIFQSNICYGNNKNGLMVIQQSAGPSQDFGWRIYSNPTPIISLATITNSQPSPFVPSITNTIIFYENTTFHSKSQLDGIFPSSRGLRIPKPFSPAYVQLTLPFPYGFSEGNSKLFITTDDYFLSNASNGVYTMSFGINNFDSITRTLDYDDILPPKIVSVEKFQFGLITVIRAHITDDSAGFSNLGFFGDYTSLISGTIQDGIYEFHLNQETLYFLETLIKICDQLLNCDKFYFHEIKSTKYNLFDSSELKITEISKYYFKYNPVDVREHGVDNSLFVCTNNSNLTPNIYHMRSGYQKDESYNSVGVYQNDIGCYQYDFHVHKNSIPGPYNFIFKLDNNFVPTLFARSYFGEEGQLKVISDFGDNLGPLITNVQLLPSGNNFNHNSGLVGNIKWRFTIEDHVNGFKSGMISIVGDLGLFKNNITLSPTLEGHLVSGDKYNGTYEVTISINPICSSQLYYIDSIKLFDENDFVTEYIRGRFVEGRNNPLMYFYHNIDELTSINVQCQPQTPDTETPILVSFDFSPKTIDTRYSGELFNVNPRLVTFTFSVTDNVGVLDSALPIIYLHDQNFQIIQQESEFLGLTSNNIAEYRCRFNIPFGYGFPGGLQVSIYGLGDLMSNFKGYSITELDMAGFPNTIQVATVLNQSISILSSSKLTSLGGEFYVMGRNFNSNDELLITDKAGTLIQSILSTSNLNSIAKFNNIVKIEDQRSVFITWKRTINNNNIEFSNSYEVFIKTIKDSSSSDSNSIGSSDSFSSNEPQQCFNQCSGNGKCTPNGCVCDSLWIGLDCSSKVIIIDPTINTTLPETNITIPTSNNDDAVFYAIISIVALNELDDKGNVLHQYPFTQWIVKNNTKSIYSQYTSTSYIYTSNITNKYDQSITTLNVSIDYFGALAQPVNITFANQILTMNPYSLKYSVNISQYSFSSSLNSLQVVLSASLESPNEDCSSIQRGNTVESESEFIKMQVNDHSLYGRFIKRGIVDGRVRQITNTPLTEGSTSSKSQTKIGINVPQYRILTQLDPDFSVLVDNRPALESSNAICSHKSKSKSKLTTAQIAGIVVGCIGVITVVAVSVSYYLYKKKQRKLFMDKIELKMANINK